MIILAYLFVIASFGPSRACSWDVLVPLGVANMIMYPINLRMKRGHWVMLIPALLLHIFYPVFFDLADGPSYFDRGTFAPNWTAAGVLGNLFLVGFCPLIGLLPFELTGMVMSHYMLEDKKATRLCFSFLSFICSSFHRGLVFFTRCFKQMKINSTTESSTGLCISDGSHGRH